jgi:hypothetical protein
MRHTKSRLGIFLAALLMVGGAFYGGFAVAAQGHMLNARSNLQAALYQLNSAVPDKAGHRVHAMNLVDEAIEQVNLGIQAGYR